MSEIHKMYDEKGEEYVVVWGGINDGKITARPAVLIGGPCPTLSPETQDFGKALATYPYRFRSRLYRSGRVDNMRGDFPENELHKVVTSVQDLYDELWPDVAQKMRDFERKALTSFNMTRAELPVKFIKAVIAKSGRSLLDLLKVVESEYLADGKIEARIGWIVSDEASRLLRCGIPPEKYRWSRAVSDVARKLNAVALMVVSEAFVKSDAEPHEPTGQSALIGQLILPNGIVTHSVAGMYETVDSRVRVVKPLQETRRQLKQHLFPPWA